MVEPSSATGGRPALEVLETVRVEEGRERLAGCNLDAPQPGLRSPNGSLGVVGWVVGRDSRATEVELVADGELVGSAPVNFARRDVARRFEGSPGSDSAGFRIALEAEGEGESELLLRAALEDGTRVPFWTLRIDASTPRADRGSGQRGR